MECYFFFPLGKNCPSQTLLFIYKVHTFDRMSNIFLSLCSDRILEAVALFQHQC